MAKTIYTGVSNVARKVGQPYIGVSNVAKKVKSGYIGVNGVAKPFFEGIVTETYTLDGTTLSSGTSVQLDISPSFSPSKLLSFDIQAYSNIKNYSGVTNYIADSNGKAWEAHGTLSDSSKTDLTQRFGDFTFTTNQYFNTDYYFYADSWNQYGSSYSSNALRINCYFNAYYGGNSQDNYTVYIQEKGYLYGSSDLVLSWNCYNLPSTFKAKVIVTLTYMS